MYVKRKHAIRITKKADELKTRGDYMRYAREKRNVSSFTLSEMCGISVAAISNWELDKVSPTLNCLELAADALGISIDEYVGHVVQGGKM